MPVEKYCLEFKAAAAFMLGCIAFLLNAVSALSFCLLKTERQPFAELSGYPYCVADQATYMVGCVLFIVGCVYWLLDVWPVRFVADKQTGKLQKRLLRADSDSDS